LDVWLLMGEQVIPARGLNSVTSSIYALTDIIGHTATLAAVSFLCFLTGTLVQIRRWPAPHHFTIHIRGDIGTKNRIQSGFQYIWWNLCSRFADPRQGAVDWVIREYGLSSSLYGEHAIANVLKADVFSKPDIDELGYALEHKFIENAEYDQLPEELKRIERERVAHDAVIKSVTSRIKAEFEQLVTRLQIEREAVHNDFDRLKSEAEMRFSMFFPLIILCAICAIRWSPYFCLGTILPLWLLREGWRKQYLAESKVWDSLKMGIIKSPIVERLREWQSAWTSPTEVTAPTAGSLPASPR
jgi:hypothetical protein